MNIFILTLAFISFAIFVFKVEEKRNRIDKIRNLSDQEILKHVSPTKGKTQNILNDNEIIKHYKKSDRIKLENILRMEDLQTNNFQEID